MNRVHTGQNKDMDLSAALGALLLKYGLAIASLVGSILSLALLRPLTKKEAAASVAIGFFTAMFTTDLVMAKFGLPTGDDSRNGVAYLIGLLAMNVIPA